MTPDVEVIIVNHNTRDELAACLESLHAGWPACVDRVVVVDNASTDGSLAMTRARWPSVAVVALDVNAGFGAANNMALRNGHTPLALLLNSDTVVPAGSIDRLRERLIARRAVAAGPRLFDGRGKPEISFGPMLTPWGELMQRCRVWLAERPGRISAAYVRSYVSRERTVDWVTGACLLVRRPEAAEAGFFDERYFLYEEDVDLCAALRARGGTILFTPSAEVIHLRGRSLQRTPGSRAESSHYDASHVAFYEKHAPGWAPWLRAWLRLRGRAIR